MTGDDQWILRWQRTKAFMDAFAQPVFLAAVVAGLFSLATGEREAEVRTLEIAMSVLQTDPEKHPEDVDLRIWAIDVINEYSGVELPAGARRALENRAFNLSAARAERALDSLQGTIDLKRKETLYESIDEIVAAVTDEGGNLLVDLLDQAVTKAQLSPQVASFLKMAKDGGDLAERLRQLDPAIITSFDFHTDFEALPKDE